jgi:hypothetical protein
MGCAVGAEIEECGEYEELAVLNVVAAATVMGEELVERGDEQLPRDGNFGQQCADSPCESQRNFGDAHHEDWEYGPEE